MKSTKLGSCFAWWHGDLAASGKETQPGGESASKTGSPATLIFAETANAEADRLIDAVPEATADRLS